MRFFPRERRSCGKRKSRDLYVRVHSLNALHMVDERPQLGEDFAPAGVVEKYAGRRRRERREQMSQSALAYRSFCDRLGHLSQADAFQGGGEQRREIVGDQRPRDRDLQGPVSVEEPPERDRAV